MNENEFIKQSYLSFSLEKELFAVSVNKVLEVLEKQHITKIPNAPVYIKGVINFRGVVLPVIESRQKFNMTPRNDDKYVVIVLDVKKGNTSLMVGAIADEVKDVLEIDALDIKPVPEMGSNYNPEFLDGMIHNDKGFLMLLNTDKIFTMSEIDIVKNAQNVELAHTIQ